MYKDGTWKYTKDFDPNDSTIIKTNSSEFTKSRNASFLLKAANANVGFWIDPKKWSFGKAVANEAADFELALKGQSLEALIISEPAEIPLESYVELALLNGRNVVPDLKIVDKEYRIVNGLKVLHLKMEGTQVGVKFSYSSYYFSNSNSTVQFLVTSYSTLMKKYAKETDELLNGIVELNPDSTSNDQKNGISNFGHIDTISQGAFSPNNNCKHFFEGKWKYNVKNQTVEVERTLNKTIEYTENRKYYSEYTNKWINSCKYELIFKKTNIPDYKLLKVGEVMTAEILQIDNKEMSYSILFRGKEIKGEMTKVK